MAMTIPKKRLTSGTSMVYSHQAETAPIFEARVRDPGTRHAGGAVANSRWEASGFMLAHPPDRRDPEFHPGRGGGSIPTPGATGEPVRSVEHQRHWTPPPLPGRRLMGAHVPVGARA